MREGFLLAIAGIGTYSETRRETNIRLKYTGSMSVKERLSKPSVRKRVECVYYVWGVKDGA